MSFIEVTVLSSPASPIKVFVNISQIAYVAPQAQNGPIYIYFSSPTGAQNSGLARIRVEEDYNTIVQLIKDAK